MSLCPVKEYAGYSTLIGPTQSGRSNGARAARHWPVVEMKRRKWSRLYWNTRENNYRARGLYDKYTPHSGFIRYVISNEG